MRQRMFGRAVCLSGLVGSLIAAFIVGTRESSSASVLAAFTFTLVAATLWVILESNALARRWFALGAGCGLAAAAILMLMSGPGVLAYQLLGKLSQNELKPVLYSGIGSSILAAWLALLCGLVGGGLGILRSRRAGVPIGLVWFLLIAGFLLLRTLVAHEPPNSDAVGQVAEGR